MKDRNGKYEVSVVEIMDEESGEEDSSEDEAPVDENDE